MEILRLRLRMTARTVYRFPANQFGKQKTPTAAPRLSPYKNELGKKRRNMPLCGGFGFIALPYPYSGYLKHPEEYEAFYDEIEICAVAAHAHPKRAIGIRNHKMIDRSDLVIVWVERKGGGADQALQYAKASGVYCINVAEETEFTLLQ